MRASDEFEAFAASGGAAAASTPDQYRSFQYSRVRCVPLEWAETARHAVIINLQDIHGKLDNALHEFAEVRRLRSVDGVLPIASE